MGYALTTSNLLLGDTWVGYLCLGYKEINLPECPIWMTGYQPETFPYYWNECMKSLFDPTLHSGNWEVGAMRLKVIHAQRYVDFMAG